MKILGTEKRDVYVAMEFGLAEMQNIARFLEDAILLYDKIYNDTEQELIQEIIEFHGQLATSIKEIEKNES